MQDVRWYTSSRTFSWCVRLAAVQIDGIIRSCNETVSVSEAPGATQSTHIARAETIQEISICHPISSNQLRELKLQNYTLLSLPCPSPSSVIALHDSASENATTAPPPESATTARLPALQQRPALAVCAIEQGSGCLLGSPRGAPNTGWCHRCLRAGSRWHPCQTREEVDRACERCARSLANSLSLPPNSSPVAPSAT